MSPVWPIRKPEVYWTAHFFHRNTDELVWNDKPNYYGYIQWYRIGTGLVSSAAVSVWTLRGWKPTVLATVQLMDTVNVRDRW